MQSEQINEMALALSKVQGAILPAKKGCDNPFFKSKYADLTAVWDSCRNELAGNNLCILQCNEDSETHLVLITTLAHSSGQWMKSKSVLSKRIPAIAAKKDKYGKDVPAQDERHMTAQEIGAATTYLRRFAVASMVGVCTEDDDGNTASGHQQYENQRALHPATPVIEYIKAVEITLLENSVNKIPGYREKLMIYLSKSYGIKEFKYLTSKLFTEIMVDVKKHLNAPKETQIETKEFANA